MIGTSQNCLRTSVSWDLRPQPPYRSAPAFLSALSCTLPNLEGARVVLRRALHTVTEAPLMIVKLNAPHGNSLGSSALRPQGQA